MEKLPLPQLRVRVQEETRFVETLSFTPFNLKFIKLFISFILIRIFPALLKLQTNTQAEKLLQ
jgi:hypothetical protein